MAQIQCRIDIWSIVGDYMISYHKPFPIPLRVRIPYVSPVYKHKVSLIANFFLISQIVLILYLSRVLYSV